MKAFTQTYWVSSHWGQVCPSGAGQGIFQSNPRQGWKVQACASFFFLAPLCLTRSGFHPSAPVHCERWGWWWEFLGVFLSTMSPREQGHFSYHRVAFSAGLGRESSPLVVSQQLSPPTLVTRWPPSQTGAQRSLGTLSGGTWRK